MGKIIIVTDSTASIPEIILHKLNINTVAYYIHRGNEVLRDLVTIKRDSFYDWMKIAQSVPKTASPGPGDYFRMYKKVIEEYNTNEIISIHMTSKGSGAYQAALVAKRMIQEKFSGLNIEVIDTLNVSLCQGWIAIEAARAALENRSIEDILSRIRELIPKVKMLQTADTLKYLYLGGRIGRAKHLVGSMLNIKPLISMENGIIVSVGQTRSMHQAYKKMVELVVDRIGADGRVKVAFVHAAAYAEVVKLKKLFQSQVAVDESFIAELSPALGVHSGPGTVGFCYFPVN